MRKGEDGRSTGIVSAVLYFCSSTFLLTGDCGGVVLEKAAGNLRMN
jgi:hypothetical protein